MRIAHFADVHLGYRAYHRLTPFGINQREQDVQNAFRDAVAKIAALDPDLVLMAGDLFHTVRPSNLVLQRAYSALSAFRARCRAPIVMIAGNHESPRSAETGCILKLFENIPNVLVRDGAYDHVRLPDLDASIFCLPHRGLVDLSQLLVRPDPASRTNLLMLHGTLEGIGHNAAESVTIPRSSVLADGWQYIACGHYHIQTCLADNAYYSGALEYTSFNPWEELGKGKPPKGFLMFDTETREATPHPVRTRTLKELAPIHAEGLTAAEVMARIEAEVGEVRGGLDEKVLRLVVWDVARKVQIDLDHARLRQLRMAALQFDLVLRAPLRRPVAGTVPDAAARRTLEQEWKEYVAERPLPGDVERCALERIGLEYLARASAETVPLDSER